jgi:drug/metabolite transporter (DMT)-like permease
MSNTRKAYLILHFCTFVWGFTAILGRLIELPAIVLVWWRLLITTIVLWLIPKLFKKARAIPKNILLQLVVVGGLVGLHWICFYGSIKLANASVGLVCMASTAFFTALIEPYLLKTPFQRYELILGLLLIPGMALVANDLDFNRITGFGVGLISAFLGAIFSTLNKKIIDSESTAPENLVITFVELGSALVLVSVILPFIWVSQPDSQWMPTQKDAFYLLILSLFCTILPYTIWLNAMKHISAFTANITLNMEPVYGIALAWAILKEDQELSPRFYVGVLWILATIFGYPFLRRRFHFT